MATTYRVVTKGVSAGRSIAEVAGALSARFRIPADKVGAALRAPRFVLKQGLNLVDAAKYDRVLREAGCRVVVEPEDGPGSRPAPRSIPSGAAATVSAADTASSDTGALSAAWHSARAWTRRLFRVRVRQGSDAWSAATPRQKAFAILLAANGVVIVAVAVLVLLPRPAARPATPPASVERAQARATVTTPATLVGTWNCSAEQSNGFAIRNSYVFRGDGTFEDQGAEVDFEGVYRNKRGRIVMTVRRARTGATTMAPNLVIDGTVTMLSASSMKLETTVRGSGERKTATCSRIAEPSASR